MQGTVHSVFWIAVAFHPALINPIDHLPPPRDAYQNNFNILRAISEASPKSLHGDLPGIILRAASQYTEWDSNPIGGFIIPPRRCQFVVSPSLVYIKVLRVGQHK